MTKVVHVIDSLGAGGAERSLAVMLPELVERGIEPTVVALGEVPASERQTIEPRIEVVTLDVRGRVDAVVRLRRLLRDLRPDLVHTTLFEADLAGRVAARGIAPSLTSLVNSSYGADRLEDVNVGPAKLRAARAVDGLTARTLTAHFHAITKAVADDAVRHLGISPDRITVIPRGRDPARLGRRTAQRRAAARASLGLRDGQPLVLNVGRREWQKGQSVLLDSLPQLVDRFPDLICAIAGRDGNESSALSDQVRRLGIDGTVRFLGHRDDVSELLCAADVLAFPSRYEGLGGVLIEALALECPIVTSDLPATREVLDDGRCGMLVPPKDPVVLREAIRATLASPQGVVDRVTAGRARFETHYELSEVCDATATLLKEVAREK